MQEIDSVPRDDFGNVNEATPLIPASLSSWLAMRYGGTRKCVSSKAALLVLLWSFAVGLLMWPFLNPDLYLTIFGTDFPLAVYYGGAAIFSCFFPLAGFLADVRCGRYKTVVTSLVLPLVSIPVILVVTVLNIFCISSNILGVFASNILGVFANCVGIIACIVAFIGLIGFTANVVQFGMDQLHDSPGEDRTLFIHWYIWTYYASMFIGQLAWNLSIIILPSNFNIYFMGYYNITGYVLPAVIVLLSIAALTITLCLARQRRRWFLIEPAGQFNPYKLVYKVTKFAHQHKIPVRRSAFTYCEDELPRGLDLGKEKYGGPFTTEQVEDVKAFYGILKVLFSFGVVFFLEFASDSILPLFALHVAPYNTYEEALHNGTLVDKLLIKNGILSPLFVVICVPLYLCMLRPIVSRYIPGMLKRMGLGMVLVLLSLLTTFSMDTAAHMLSRNESSSLVPCMFRINIFEYFPSPPHPLHSTYLAIQSTLSGLARMLIYIGVFEFICSQSPHSMKGLLIGVLYAIRGLYQLVAALLSIPYYLVETFHPSCGFYFYLVNIVIGLFAVLLYVWVAKRYRYRVRDELCEVHRYAEEYYSNTQRERHYD